MSVINIISDSDSDGSTTNEREDVMFERQESSIKQEENDFQDEEISQLFGKDSTKTALQILFNGARYESTSKPYGIRKNYFCTLKHDTVKIDSCKADGNGVYAKRSNYTTCLVEYDGNKILWRFVAFCDFLWPFVAFVTFCGILWLFVTFY